MKTTLRIWLYLAQFFLEWEMFQTKRAEEIKTHILCSITFFFFRKSCLLWNDVEKFCRAWQAADDNMAHVHCMLDNTLTIFLYFVDRASYNDQRDAEIPFYVFIFIFNSLRVSSTSCSSSGETNCVNTTSGNCHSENRWVYFIYILKDLRYGW